MIGGTPILGNPHMSLRSIQMRLRAPPDFL